MAKRFEEEIGRRLTAIEKDLKDHMNRTLLLEQFQARWSGAFLALTGLATLAGVAFAAINAWAKIH